MKSKYIIQSLLIVLISLYFIACDDKPNIVKPNGLEGNFSKVFVSCDSILVVINNSGSSYNPAENSKSWSSDKDGVWAFGGTFINTDSSNSKIINDTLKFKYYFKQPGSYNSSNSTSVSILFNDTTQMIDWLYITSSNHYEPAPPHMSRSSYSSSGSSIKLSNIPFTINPTGDIIVEFTGADIMNYNPIITQGSSENKSDYSSYGGSYYNNAYSVKSIRSVPITSTFKIEIIKAK